MITEPTDKRHENEHQKLNKKLYVQTEDQQADINNNSISSEDTQEPPEIIMALLHQLNRYNPKSGTMKINKFFSLVQNMLKEYEIYDLTDDVKKELLEQMYSFGVARYGLYIYLTVEAYIHINNDLKKG